VHASWKIRARAPRGDERELALVRDPDVVGLLLEDAAHSPGGHSPGLIVATSEAVVARALREFSAVLPIGAQSSLTGGATPHGELLLSSRSLNRILEIGADFARVQAGVTLVDLQAALEARGLLYPPAPTFTGAFVGGTVATNAAGAATFKYGTTRDWIRALTVVLPTGDVLDLERNATHASPQGHFEIERCDGRTIQIRVPTYRMPSVPKLSAGYYAAPGMDLIDLFIGAEGTLGIITEVTLRVVPSRPATCLAFVPFREQHAGIAFVHDMRRQARQAWSSHGGRGLDISAIEHMDGRSLELLREDRIDRATGVSWPDETRLALLVTLELSPGTRREEAFTEIGRFRDADAPDTPLVRFCKALDAAGVFDAVEVALPGDRRRVEQLLRLREGVPAAVNQRVGLAKRRVDRRIEKTAADMVVPFENFERMLELYTAEFAKRGLDAAVWGHVSDGNVHPNVIPRSYDDVAAGKEAILAFGREVIRLGGAPLAEHGVGRNAVKQQLLVELYGPEGVEEMRRVKRAIDPEWKLSPGVLFPVPGS
jgi:D-lactate dehydrogenase (cytochrome)